MVLGTAALRDPDLVRGLARSHRIAVGLDARAGEVATDGWLQGSGRSVLDVARSFAADGVDAFVVTEISRDGTLEGPDVDGLASRRSQRRLPGSGKDCQGRSRLARLP